MDLGFAPANEASELGSPPTMGPFVGAGAANSAGSQNVERGPIRARQVVPLAACHGLGQRGIRTLGDDLQHLVVDATVGGDDPPT